MGVYDTQSYPWLTGEIDFIGSLLERRIPMLGICLGAQLIAAALEADVKPMGYREIGWRPVKGGDSSLTVFHWHGDTFDIPAGAKRIFSNDACENQGFIRETAVALQFHLEMDENAVQRLLSAGSAEITESLGRGDLYVQTAETVLAQAREREESPPAAALRPARFHIRAGSPRGRSRKLVYVVILADLLFPAFSLASGLLFLYTLLFAETFLFADALCLLELFTYRLAGETGAFTSIYSSAIIVPPFLPVFLTCTVLFSNFLVNLLMPMCNVKIIALFSLLASAALLQGEEGFCQEGEASWYGPGFQGRQTASGERFDTNKLTAAHRTLPFGTMVRVTNRDNGKSVTVRINDRGPFIAGRIIDLSQAAAERLDMLKTGTAQVVIETVSTPPDDGGLKSVQVASFRRIGYAEQLVKELEKRSLKAEIERAGSYYRVLLPGVKEDKLEETLTTLKEMGFGNPLVR